jgi:hypothetical protein
VNLFLGSLMHLIVLTQPRIHSFHSILQLTSLLFSLPPSLFGVPFLFRSTVPRLAFFLPSEGLLSLGQSSLSLRNTPINVGNLPLRIDSLNVITVDVS